MVLTAHVRGFLLRAGYTSRIQTEKAGKKIKPYHKRPLDDEFRKDIREIKRQSFRLLRESQNIRMKWYFNGVEADADPLGSAIDRIIGHAMAAAFESIKSIKQLGLDNE